MELRRTDDRAILPGGLRGGPCSPRRVPAASQEDDEPNGGRIESTATTTEGRLHRAKMAMTLDPLEGLARGDESSSHNEDEEDDMLQMLIRKGLLKKQHDEGFSRRMVEPQDSLDIVRRGDDEKDAAAKNNREGPVHHHFLPPEPQDSLDMVRRGDDAKDTTGAHPTRSPTSTRRGGRRPRRRLDDEVYATAKVHVRNTDEQAKAPLEPQDSLDMVRRGEDAEKAHPVRSPTATRRGGKRPQRRRRRFLDDEVYATAKVDVSNTNEQAKTSYQIITNRNQLHRPVAMKNGKVYENPESKADGLDDPLLGSPVKARQEHSIEERQFDAIAASSAFASDIVDPLLGTPPPRRPNTVSRTAPMEDNDDDMHESNSSFLPSVPLCFSDDEAEDEEELDLEDLMGMDESVAGSKPAPVLKSILKKSSETDQDRPTPSATAHMHDSMPEIYASDDYEGRKRGKHVDFDTVHVRTFAVTLDCVTPWASQSIPHPRGRTQWVPKMTSRQEELVHMAMMNDSLSTMPSEEDLSLMAELRGYRTPTATAPVYCPLTLDWAYVDDETVRPALLYGYHSYFGPLPLPPRLTANERRQRLATVHDTTVDDVEDWEYQELVRQMSQVSLEQMLSTNGTAKQLCHDSKDEDAILHHTRNIVEDRWREGIVQGVPQHDMGLQQPKRMDSASDDSQDGAPKKRSGRRVSFRDSRGIDTVPLTPRHVLDRTEHHVAGPRQNGLDRTEHVTRVLKPELDEDHSEDFDGDRPFKLTFSGLEELGVATATDEDGVRRHNIHAAGGAALTNGRAISARHIPARHELDFTHHVRSKPVRRPRQAPAQNDSNGQPIAAANEPVRKFNATTMAVAGKQNRLLFGGEDITETETEEELLPVTVAAPAKNQTAALGGSASDDSADAENAEDDYTTPIPSPSPRQHSTPKAPTPAAIRRRMQNEQVAQPRDDDMDNLKDKLLHVPLRFKSMEADVEASPEQVIYWKRNKIEPSNSREARVKEVQNAEVIEWKRDTESLDIKNVEDEDGDVDVADEDGFILASPILTKKGPNTSKDNFNSPTEFSPTAPEPMSWTETPSSGGDRIVAVTKKQWSEQLPFTPSLEALNEGTQ